MVSKFNHTDDANSGFVARKALAAGSNSFSLMGNLKNDMTRYTLFFTYCFGIY